jgi:hypothetical protein
MTVVERIRVRGERFMLSSKAKELSLFSRCAEGLGRSVCILEYRSSAQPVAVSLSVAGHFAEWREGRIVGRLFGWNMEIDPALSLRWTVEAESR